MNINKFAHNGDWVELFYYPEQFERDEYIDRLNNIPQRGKELIICDRGNPHLFKSDRLGIFSTLREPSDYARRYLEEMFKGSLTVEEILLIRGVGL